MDTVPVRVAITGTDTETVPGVGTATAPRAFRTSTPQQQTEAAVITKQNKIKKLIDKSTQEALSLFIYLFVFILLTFPFQIVVFCQRSRSYFEI